MSDSENSSREGSRPQAIPNSSNPNIDRTESKDIYSLQQLHLPCPALPVTSSSSTSTPKDTTGDTNRNIQSPMSEQESVSKSINSSTSSKPVSPKDLVDLEIGPTDPVPLCIQQLENRSLKEESSTQNISTTNLEYASEPQLFSLNEDNSDDVQGQNSKVNLDGDYPLAQQRELFRAPEPYSPAPLPENPMQAVADEQEIQNRRNSWSPLSLLGSVPFPRRNSETVSARRRSSSFFERQHVFDLRKLSERQVFLHWPFFKYFFVRISTSEARDFCAIERNFMSWMKTSLYLAMAGATVLINIRLPMIGNNNDAIRELSDRISASLGYIFFALSALTLLNSMLNYIHAVAGYAQKQSVVENTILTQILVALLALSVLTTNILILATE